jgi:hypothetical protein
MRPWRSPETAWLYEFAGESLRQYPEAGRPELLAHFNWTMGYDGAVFDEQTLLFLAGSLRDYVTADPVAGRAAAAALGAR